MSTVAKEWAAVDGDKILLTRPSKVEAKEACINEGIPLDAVELVVLPKPHRSVFL